MKQELRRGEQRRQREESWTWKSHSPIHTALLYTGLFLSHTIHTLMAQLSAVLPKNTMECSLEVPGIERPTFWLVIMVSGRVNDSTSIYVQL